MKVDTKRTDNWRCRFFSSKAGQTVTHAEIVALLGRFAAAGYDFIKTEHLYNFDGQPGFTQPQGA